MENLLLVSGDYVTLGDHPQAKPVYDADSVQLLDLARGLMEGRDQAGLELHGVPVFYLGAAVIPEAEPLAPQLIKFEKKVAAGARFFITPPVFDLEKFRSFRERLPVNPVKILAAAKVLSAEEVQQAAAGQWRKVYSVPPDLLAEFERPGRRRARHQGRGRGRAAARQLQAEKLVDGVYIKAKGRSDLFDQVLAVAGF